MKIESKGEIEIKTNYYNNCSIERERERKHVNPQARTVVPFESRKKEPANHHFPECDNYRERERENKLRKTYRKIKK